MSNYVLKPVNVADPDIVEMAELLRVVFPDAEHFTTEVVRWQYKDNPDGQVVGFNAWSGEVLAAHYVTIPLMAMVDGVATKGLLSLNTGTHPAHQGKGLFTKLAHATYERAASEGFGFVIGVANGNSTHGFTKKLGFQLVSPLRAMIGAGPLHVEGNDRTVRYEQVRTPEALAWRLSHPLYRYEGALSGHTRLLLSKRRQYGCRYIMQAKYDGVLPAGIARTSPPVRKVWIGLDPSIRWGGSAYMNIPLRFRPSPLNLIFKDLTGQGRRLNAQEVRFHALDFDIL